MKVRVLYIILFLLVGCEIAVSSQGVNYDIVESTDQFIIVDVRFDSISFVQKMQDGQWVSEIFLPGAGAVITPDQSRLPMLSLMLGIPPASTPNITVMSAASRTRHVGALAVCDVPLSSKSGINSAFDMSWPRAFVQKGAQAVVRHQHVLQVNLFPVIYQATAQTAQIAESVRFRINFNASSGGAALASPVDDGFESVYKNVLANYKDSRKWRQATPGSSLKKSTAMNLQQVKLYLSADGIYVVTGQDLAQAGVDLTSIYPPTLSLFNNGKHTPIIVEGAADGSFDIDDRIIFLGSHNSGDHSFLSFYSDVNVYMLSWGGPPGLAFSPLPAWPNGNEPDTLDYAPHKIHFEKDLRFERLVGYHNGADDHWFWQKIMDNEVFATSVDLPGFDSESSLMLTAKFHGLTESVDVDMNHHVTAYVNNQLVGEGFGSDKKQFSLRTGRFKLDVALPKIDVRFELPLDVPDVLIDQAFLNWFEIDYDRALVADNDLLSFQIEPRQGRLWRAAGFRSDQVYLLTDNGYRLVNPVTKSAADGYQFEFIYNSAQPAVLYMASQNALKSVDRVEMDQPSNLQNPANSADYLIITHKEFREAAERLAEYRRDSGLRTMVVDIQDVYDEFSGGIFDPRAIKRFIAYAFENWQRPAPLYVLLFGDATYLMDKKAGREAKFHTFVPSFMVNTKTYGLSSSDNYFVAVSGNDDLPDLHIGRLPANSPDQAEAMVDKIISYETKDIAAEWRRHITLAAGNGEFFDYSAQYLVDHYLPKWLSTHRLSTEFKSPHFNTTETFIRWINDGQNIIDFLVHGSGEQIADANLLNKDDIIRLTNTDRYAFAVTMSCYIGHFDNPEVDALGEALLVAKDKGVMGLFGSSGKSYSYSDFYFNGAIFDGIFQEGWRSLGEITTKAKFRLIEKTLGFWEPVDNFLLLGDPATMLQLPREEIILTLSKKVLAEGDVLAVSGKLPQTRPGSLKLSVLSEQDSVLVEKEVELFNDRFAVDIMTMTADLRKKWGTQGGEGRVQAYFSDGHYNAVGLSSFSVVRPLVSRFALLPEKPVGFEPFNFVAEISADVAAEVGGIQSLQVKWTTDNRNWNALPMARQNNDSWQTIQTLALEEGTTIWYKLVFATGTGTTAEMDVQEYKVLYKPDVYWSTDVRYCSDPALLLTVKNRGESDARNVAVKVVNKTTGATVIDGLILPLVAARRDTIVRVSMDALPAGSFEFELKLDPDNLLREEEEENNILNKTLHVVTAEQGSNGEFSYTSHGVSVMVPAGALSQSSSVELIALQDEALWQAATGAALAILPVKGQSVPRLFGFLCSDSTLRLQASPGISLNIDTTDSLTSIFLSSNSVKIYAWDETAHLWGAQPTTRTGDRLSASLPPGSMAFAVMGSADAEPPTVHIAIPGQNFADGDIVPANPLFTIAVEDDGGIDVSLDHFQVLLDDTRLLDSDYAMVYDPAKAGDVKITYPSDLNQGEHTLQVNVRDINGNSASQRIQFRIAEEFGLDFIANHPNPFERETTFAFQISDMASSVSLNIYTVSGRLIRSFEFTDITGYNEVDWDGVDAFGSEIANGVYYLKFIARQGDKKIERIEKLAKLK